MLFTQTLGELMASSSDLNMIKPESIHMLLHRKLSYQIGYLCIFSFEKFGAKLLFI